MKAFLFVATLFLSGCVANDKLLHAGAGSAVYAGSRAAGLSPMQSLGACTAAGVAKEVYDSTGQGTVDGMDVVATALPCAVFALTEQHVVKRNEEPRIEREDVDLSPIRQ